MEEARAVSATRRLMSLNPFTNKRKKKEEEVQARYEEQQLQAMHELEQLNATPPPAISLAAMGARHARRYFSTGEPMSAEVAKMTGLCSEVRAREGGARRARALFAFQLLKKLSFFKKCTKIKKRRRTQMLGRNPKSLLTEVVYSKSHPLLYFFFGGGV